MSDQPESLVLWIIFGTSYHGIHAFCILSMKIPHFGIEMVKLIQEVEPWGPPCLFKFCEIPIFFKFLRIFQQKQTV